MSQKRRILVVDDDELLRKGTVRLLEQAGYEVDAAEDGASTFAALEKSVPDLILLDVALPDINGREICRRIRKDSRFKEVYVVMLSSTRIASEDQVQGLEDGADGYISRPIPNRELTARVNAILRLKEAEETLRRSEIRQLEARKNESIGILSGGIAHDFNNLLSIIIGNIELAQDHFPSNHPATECLDDAMEACRWAISITRKFLTLSQSTKPALQAGIIGKVIDAALAELGLQADIQVKLDIPADLPIVHFDRLQIQQAMVCLITNAVEAMPQGGTLHICVYPITGNTITGYKNLGLSENEYMAVVVTDSGVGIPQNALPKIFDPYFSTKERGSRKGMGLGLATANAIINKHNGTLQVDTAVNKGTSVTVYLPLFPNPTT